MTWTRALAPAIVAEVIGTAYLLIGVVGSGIAAERLTDDVGLQLLQNALATGAVLVAIILAFGSVSGAHFNPAVTLAERWFGSIDTPTAIAYVTAQLVGAVIGVVAANIMFDLPAIDWSTTERSGGNLVVAEVVATFGLLLLIVATARTRRSSSVAVVVGAYIAGAYYFTSSTSFANPAVTVARTLSDTFAGIEPASAPWFLAAQLSAVVLVVPVVRLLFPAGDGDPVTIDSQEVSS